MILNYINRNYLMFTCNGYVNEDGLVKDVARAFGLTFERAAEYVGKYQAEYLEEAVCFQ
jgi:hypothetical protein